MTWGVGWLGVTGGGALGLARGSTSIAKGEQSSNEQSRAEQHRAFAHCETLIWHCSHVCVCVCVGFACIYIRRVCVCLFVCMYGRVQRTNSRLHTTHATAKIKLSLCLSHSLSLSLAAPLRVFAIAFAWAPTTLYHYLAVYLSAARSRSLARTASVVVCKTSSALNIQSRCDGQERVVWLEGVVRLGVWIAPQSATENFVRLYHHHCWCCCCCCRCFCFHFCL